MLGEVCWVMMLCALSDWLSIGAGKGREERGLCEFSTDRCAEGNMYGDDVLSLGHC